MNSLILYYRNPPGVASEILEGAPSANIPDVSSGNFIGLISDNTLGFFFANIPAFTSGNLLLILQKFFYTSVEVFIL